MNKFAVKFVRNARDHGVHDRDRMQQAVPCLTSSAISTPLPHITPSQGQKQALKIFNKMFVRNAPNLGLHDRDQMP